MEIDTQTTGTVAPQDDASATQADTAAIQSSEADVQVEQVAPEAAQETQGTPEITATDTAEDRLYAGKYKSVDDLEKSYTELQSKATRDAQEKAELARILNESFASPEPTPVVAQDTESYEEPAPTQSSPDTSVQRDLAVMKFMMSHEGANGAEMNKVLTEDPMIGSITSYEAKLEYAYLKSQSGSLKKVVAAAEQRGSEQTLVKTAEKQAAQVETVKQQSQPAGNEQSSTSDLRDTLRNDKAFDEMVKKNFPGIAKMRTRT